MAKEYYLMQYVSGIDRQPLPGEIFTIGKEGDSQPKTEEIFRDKQEALKALDKERSIFVWDDRNGRFVVCAFAVEERDTVNGREDITDTYPALEEWKPEQVEALKKFREENPPGPG